MVAIHVPAGTISPDLRWEESSSASASTNPESFVQSQSIQFNDLPPKRLGGKELNMKQINKLRYG